jgi:hypothetical protein
MSLTKAQRRHLGQRLREERASRRRRTPTWSAHWTGRCRRRSCDEALARRAGNVYRPIIEPPRGVAARAPSHCRTAKA